MEHRHDWVFINPKRQKCNSSFLVKNQLKKAEKLKPYIDKMNAEPTGENLTKARNQGLDFMEIINGVWQKVNLWNDDFDNYRYILLYREYTFEPYAIGRY